MCVALRPLPQTTNSAQWNNTHETVTRGVTRGALHCIVPESQSRSPPHESRSTSPGVPSRSRAVARTSPRFSAFGGEGQEVLYPSMAKVVQTRAPTVAAGRWWKGGFPLLLPVQGLSQPTLVSTVGRVMSTLDVSIQPATGLPRQGWESGGARYPTSLPVSNNPLFWFSFPMPRAQGEQSGTAARSAQSFGGLAQGRDLIKRPSTAGRDHPLPLILEGRTPASCRWFVAG